MSVRDPAETLRSVSALRALCLALPHAPTPAEGRRLLRFRALAAAPELATSDDGDAIADGWRDWWGAGRVDALLGMAARVPAVLVEGDRRLASYLVAARVGLVPDPAAVESTPQNSPLEARS